MDELHKLHKIHSWMWETEKRYPGRPDGENAWEDIIQTASELAEDLELKQGSYERRLIALFMQAKEMRE